MTQHLSECGPTGLQSRAAPPHPKFSDQIYPDLVVQGSKAAGWGAQSDPAGVNSVCQDPVLVVASPSPSFMTDCQGLGPKSPLQPPWCGVRSEEGLPQSGSQCWGRLAVTPGSLFWLEEVDVQGDLLAGCCTGLGEGSVAASPSPSAICLGLWAAGGASASPPLLGFSQWCPVLECTLVVLMRGRKSGTAYVTVLVTSLPLNILIIFEQGDLHFHFALGPTNDVASHS